MINYENEKKWLCLFGIIISDYSLGQINKLESEKFKSQTSNLQKMEWFNQPKEWNFENKKLSMFTTPKTDYWRITHYGFVVDDGPFFHAIFVLLRLQILILHNKI